MRFEIYFNNMRVVQIYSKRRKIVKRFLYFFYLKSRKTSALEIVLLIIAVITNVKKQ